MAEDKDKQQYSYRPNIEYQDTYESEHTNKNYKSVNANKDDSSQGNEIMDSITDRFNEISKAIPLFPAELQTAINNVYKPILDDWAAIRKETYPGRIPNEDNVIYEPGKSSSIPPYTTPPGTGDPTPGEEFYLYPEPPDGVIPTEPSYEEESYIVDDDSLWEPELPMTIKFVEVDPEDIIKKEYIKNVADLYNYYTDRLKNILYHYYAEKLMAVNSKKKDDNVNLTNKTVNDIAFMFLPITDCCSDVEENCKHLFDASLAMGEKASLKLNFLENTFPLEQTLYHLKTFKTIQELRLRYAGIDPSTGKDRTESLSNNILKGMKTSYNQKYDVAFTNLYKYLNSSLDILEDTINTELAGMKARRTLIEKGGIKK